MSSESVTIITPKQSIQIRQTLKDLWTYREVLWRLVVRDVKVRYKQTALGAAWAILQPVLKMAVFSVFFSRIAKLPYDNIPYPLFVYCGLLPWQLFEYALVGSTSSIEVNEKLITKVYFPRLVIPLSAVLAGLVDFCIVFIGLLFMFAFYHIKPTVNIWALPFFILLTLASALAAGLWLCALNVQFRDVRYTIPFLTQFWFFLTPVILPLSVMPVWIRPWCGLNPMAGVVEGFRWALLGAEPHHTVAFLVISGATVVFMLIGGLIYFRRLESTFADVL